MIWLYLFYNLLVILVTLGITTFVANKRCTEDSKIPQNLCVRKAQKDTLIITLIVLFIFEIFCIGGYCYRSNNQCTTNSNPSLFK